LAPSFRGAHQLSQNRVLRNQTFANPASLRAGNSLAHATFQGRFAGHQNYRHHHRGIVIGWLGPLFWPYAYDDIFEYAFLPYAYDTFWPYAYDDVYGGIFGPYAYEYDNVYGSGRQPQRGAQVCAEQATSLTNWPVERIAQTVEPDAAQMSALDRLMSATQHAVDIMQAACPTRLPSTPTGRLATLQTRLEVMLQAVDTVGPALDAFYQSLSDEQRARFNAIGSEREPNLANQEQRDLTQVCGERRTGIALPIDRIAQAVRPSGQQAAALDELASASTRAAEALKSNCPSEAALTPTGRVDAMRQRLTAMLDAVRTVRPALEAFYGSLSYEQKARFNIVGEREG
jgi:hypothetical protein